MMCSLSFTFNHFNSFAMERGILRMKLSLVVIIVVVLSMTIFRVSGEKAYLFNTASKANWFKANVFCETNNMRLVSIHSLEEHNLILRKADELGLKYARWWTAGNDLAENRKFYWGFREKMAYTNWDVAQPDNHQGKEHCTEIWHRDGRFLWNDWPCTEENLFICEYHKNVGQVGARASNLTLDEISTKVPHSME